MRGQSRLEHEGERAALADRRQGLGGSLLEGLGVGPVRQHGVVQAHAAGQEAARLGVVDTLDEAHEFRHQVHMVPRRPEGILSHHPALRSEEHTSELQSLMSISYAAFCLKKKTQYLLLT